MKNIIMRKFALVLAMILMLAVLASCSQNTQTEDLSQSSSDAQTSDGETSEDSVSTKVIEGDFIGEWIPYTTAEPGGEPMNMEDYAKEVGMTLEEIELVYEFKADGTVVTTMDYLNFTLEGTFEVDGDVITTNFQDVTNEMTYDSESDTIELVEASTGYITVFTRK